MKLYDEDDDDSTSFIRLAAIADAVREEAEQNPEWRTLLHEVLDRRVVIAEERELLELPPGCFPDWQHYDAAQKRELEAIQRQLAELAERLDAGE